MQSDDKKVDDAKEKLKQHFQTKKKQPVKIPY